MRTRMKVGAGRNDMRAGDSLSNNFSAERTVFDVSGARIFCPWTLPTIRADIGARIYAATTILAWKHFHIHITPPFLKIVRRA